MDVDGRLFHQDSGYRLEGYLEIDVLTVADASLNTTGTVGTCPDASVVVIENVILLASFLVHAAESLSVFESFYGIDAQHGITQGRMQLSEYRLPQSDRTAFDDAGDDTSDGIAFAFDVEDVLFHDFGKFHIRTTDRILFDVAQIVLGVVFIQLIDTYLRSKGSHADTELFQGQFGQGATHYAGDGLTGRGAAASPMVAESVFLRIGVIGV